MNEGTQRRGAHKIEKRSRSRKFRVEWEVPDPVYDRGGT